MKVAISQSNYIPWKGYFDLVNRVDVFVLYDDMQYTRRDWRNRNKIKISRGTQWLTIPVKVKGKYFQRINETRICDQKWPEKHWRTIELNYKKAKYFFEYRNVFKKIYSQMEEEFLSIINYKFIKCICKLLGINTEIIWSSEFDLVGDRNERLLNICTTLGASEYISGPSAQSYMDIDLFKNNMIKVSWMNYDDYPEYSQTSYPFEHGVTILDLIFNEGPESKTFMKSFGG